MIIQRERGPADGSLAMKSTLHAAVLCALGVGALASSVLPLRADVIYLKDGTKLEGDVKRRDDGWVVFSKGKITPVLPEQVQSIELTPPSDAGPKEAAERLASLRRSVEGVTDIREIISRYQRFIEQTKEIGRASC